MIYLAINAWSNYLINLMKLRLWKRSHARQPGARWEITVGHPFLCSRNHGRATRVGLIFYSRLRPPQRLEPRWPSLRSSYVLVVRPSVSFSAGATTHAHPSPPSPRVASVLLSHHIARPSQRMLAASLGAPCTQSAPHPAPPRPMSAPPWLPTPPAPRSCLGFPSVAKPGFRSWVFPQPKK